VGSFRLLSLLFFDKLINTKDVGNESFDAESECNRAPKEMIY